MSIVLKFKKTQVEDITGEAPNKDEISRFNSTPVRELFQEYGREVLDTLSSTQLKELMYEFNIDTKGDFEGDVEAVAKALEEEAPANNKRKREDEDDEGREIKKTKSADEYIPAEEEEEDDEEAPVVEEETVASAVPATNGDANDEE
eukprot:CAMPEP_0117448874 /NCGR_PEP_ID=MMETSP0759-20121206/7637_1 /TAXON_ID=63605 /ORGANISM="Percolomonas cosmopolitus, Strain WS" /LENGTH=146 /DNA_ID=CAMNT_0005241297 /DNA_START=103 /DNA_END=543 /DNA_ORIENTATION=-